MKLEKPYWYFEVHPVNLVNPVNKIFLV